MAKINVQFTDATETVISAYFNGPQNEEAYANLGTVDTSDKRWATFFAVVGGAECGLPAPTAS